MLKTSYKHYRKRFLKGLFTNGCKKRLEDVQNAVQNQQ
ncbi:hypothetical protein BBG19_0429 [Francisella sp. MA067296]|nr:hypothetical protein BBG19_0429 [Francisella sp. MA067296]